MNLPFTSNRSIGLPVWALGAGDPIRVLLIDDDEDEASLTRSLLARVEDIRYELDWVPTFGQGLTAIAHDPYDAYLIDHQLGGQTGTDLVREARAAGSLAALIVLTGHRDRATDLAAMDAGATDFLLKGKTDAALLDRTLRYAISQSAMASALERSRNQLAGLEEIGRILVEDGPTPATIGRVVELIVDRFFARQIAIYLVDGDTLQLAGQHGYEHALPSLSRFDASVDRVVRARQPVFVPSLSPAPGVCDPGRALASELSVPLIVAGELAGLLNVGSPAAEPIGEQDFSAIRLVADRLTAALEIMHEQRAADERLSEARRQQRGGPRPPAQQGLIDGETLAYRRPLLEPLLELAIASARAQPSQKLGMLLIACAETNPDTMTRLADHARTAFAHRPCVRFAEAKLAVLVAATDVAVVRSEAGDLVALAQVAGLEVWCGYASVATGGGAIELIAAAEAAVEYARRVGPGAFVG